MSEVAKMLAAIVFRTFPLQMGLCLHSAALLKIEDGNGK